MEIYIGGTHEWQSYTNKKGEVIIIKGCTGITTENSDIIKEGDKTYKVIERNRNRVKLQRIIVSQEEAQKEIEKRKNMILKLQKEISLIERGLLR